jgi:hypothetical protein
MVTGQWRFTSSDQPDLFVAVGGELGIDPGELHMILTVVEDDPENQSGHIILTLVHGEETLSTESHDKVRLYLEGWLSVAMASDGEGMLN